MDPLSATASILAVLGALAASAKGLRKLLALRKSPKELSDLIHEVTALRSLLRIVHASLLNLGNITPLQAFLQELQYLLKPVEQGMVELDKLTKHQLRRRESPKLDILPHVSAMTWLKGGPDISHTKQGIRDARSNLHAALTAFNCNLLLGFVQ